MHIQKNYIIQNFKWSHFEESQWRAGKWSQNNGLQVFHMTNTT